MKYENDEKINEFLSEQKKFIESVGMNVLFPIESRLEDYAPFFSSEYELKKWSRYEDSASESEKIILVAKSYKFIELCLDEYSKKGEITSHKYIDGKFIMQAANYEIHLKVLHFGDVVQYTVNKKTKKIGNRLRACSTQAIKENLSRFI